MQFGWVILNVPLRAGSVFVRTEQCVNVFVGVLLEKCQGVVVLNGTVSNQEAIFLSTLPQFLFSFKSTGPRKKGEESKFADTICYLQ
jgi:hypothetical protein